ncbi:DUF5074 domain-containing protein [Mucilaginibacter sp. Bleaf8]|uniref:DUF5074 domain-containing protein n=1 Tax=Mucilaginibacter sp. Bleaf8 TaxID=2834430 RepID=UPI001BCBE561|nr:DUF5074 domain-containing protein [Mucilaginibacter sp. Bleaf8]MBS7562820.1 DUF5074 domain-containing protein [Mucilaginibacter sp. Bleaf8]
MHKKLTIKRSLTIFGILLIGGISSCKKDTALEITPEPPVAQQPAGNGRDTITVGQSVSLHPKLATKSGLTYIWTVNGAPTGTDSVLAFKPDARGDYQIAFKASNAGGSTAVNYNIHVWGKYENGFFQINEGWFGHGTGTVGFYRYDTQKLEDSVYTKENPGKTLDPVSSTLEYGTIFNNKLFLVSKVGGPIVVTDAYSLKETGRVASAGGNDWRAFVGIDANKGLVSSQKGVFPLDLTTLTIGAKIDAISGQAGDMIKAGNYVFVLAQTGGVIILNASDYSVAKKISGMVVGFARTPDGAVWAAGGTSLVKINPTTLDVQTVTVPFTVFGSWGAWHPGSITASTKENLVYLAQNKSFSGGKTIYRYLDGDAASLQNAFITLPTGKELYGAGIGYNPQTNQLQVSTVQSGYGTNYSFNNLYFHDAVTGQLKKDVAYTGYYFPAVSVFH